MNNNKPKLFLAPVSSNDLFKNYQKTVEIGIDKFDFLKFQNAKKYCNLFSELKIIRLWGIKNSKLTPYNKASINDIVLFYHKGFIVGKATINHKEINQNLSNEIWGFHFDIFKNKTEYWENILFLENFELINMNFKVLIDFASFSPKASVRGFNEYSQTGVSALLNVYNSIDHFLNEYK